MSPIPMSTPASMFGEDSARQPVSTNSDYIQPNLGHGLRIWWAFFWRNTLISLILGFMLGIAVVMLYKVIPFSKRHLVIFYGAYVVEYVVAIFVMHFIVRKKFRAFRIILTAVGYGDTAQILQPTFGRTFRIWWTYTWRTVIYLTVLSIAMSVPLGFISGAVAVIYPPLGDAFLQFARTAIAGAVGLYTIYANILDEDIAGFRVSLAPRSPTIPLPENAPNRPATEAASPTSSGTS